VKQLSAQFSLALVSLVLLVSLPLPADEGSAKITYPSSQIDSALSLKWEGTQFPVKKNSDRFEAELKGVFLENNWVLLFSTGEQAELKKGVTATKKDKPFVLHVPIQGEETHVVLIGISPEGATQKDMFDLQYDNWIKPESLAADHRLCSVLFCLKSFQISPAYLFNVVGANASMMVAWTPSLQKSWYRIRANLGVIPLRGLTTSWFAEFEYSLAASIKVWRPFWVETFAGMQVWTDYLDQNPVVGGNVIYRFDSKILLWIDLLSVGYSVYLSPGNPTHQLKLGVGLSF
jgi:hypothetical protein